MELALIELGYTQVFPHVGSSTQVQVLGSTRYVWPLVTGAYGSTDFLYSFLGESRDSICEVSLADLRPAFATADSQDSQAVFERIRFLLNVLPAVQPDLDTLQQTAFALASRGDVFHLLGTPGPGPALSPLDISNAIYPVFALRDSIVRTAVSSLKDVLLCFCCG